MTTPRILPPLTPSNTAFWTGGGEQHLLIEHCSTCSRWQHPPSGACTRCGGAVDARPVSGDATVFTFTINHHQYHPDVPPPYVIAIVELVEQADLRLPTNIVGCEPDEVRIGMPVRVRFEDHGEVHVPVFAPVSAVEPGAR